MQSRQNTAPEAALLTAGVVHVLRLDDGAVPVQSAAQQEIRRHVVVGAGLHHKGKARLPDAVFIVAQQGLADAQLPGRLPLGDALLLPQQAQCAGKISRHSLSPVLFLFIRSVNYIFFITRCK